MRPAAPLARRVSFYFLPLLFLRAERKVRMRAAAAEAAAEVEEYRAMRALRLNSSTPEAAATLERLCVFPLAPLAPARAFSGLRRGALS